VTPVNKIFWGQIDYRLLIVDSDFFWCSVRGETFGMQAAVKFELAGWLNKQGAKVIGLFPQERSGFFHFFFFFFSFFSFFCFSVAALPLLGSTDVLVARVCSKDLSVAGVGSSSASCTTMRRRMRTTRWALSTSMEPVISDQQEVAPTLDSRLKW
jgi:hypothetical protein